MSDVIYNETYYRRHLAYANSNTEKNLNEFRAEFVKSFLDNSYITTPFVVDYGCSHGAFLATVPEKLGTEFDYIGVDINPYCVSHCVRSGIKAYSPEMFDYFHSGRTRIVPAIMTFWDVLEHLRDPRALLQFWQPCFLFVSLPSLNGFYDAYGNTADIQLWKHYRPFEHIWNFTEENFEKFLRWCGYETVGISYEESAIRVDSELKAKNIMTFAAIRK